MKLTIIPADTESELPLPLAEQGVKAGFPSPAHDDPAERIDLNRELIRHPSSTFYVRVSGNSMQGCGIDNGDLLIVDRSLSPRSGDIVVALIDGEFTLKRLRIDKAQRSVWLLPANDEYPPIHVGPDNDFVIWGVVTYNIKPQLHSRH